MPLVFMAGMDDDRILSACRSWSAWLELFMSQQNENRAHPFMALHSGECRLHVNAYNDRCFKYYVGLPPNVELPDFKKTWTFKTKEDAEKFAAWFDDVLLTLEYTNATEVLAPHGATPVEAIDLFVKHLEAEKAEQKRWAEERKSLGR